MDTHRPHPSIEVPGYGPAVVAALGGSFWLLAWWSGLVASAAAGVQALALLPLPLLLVALLAFLYRRYASSRGERWGLLAAAVGAAALLVTIVLAPFAAAAGPDSEVGLLVGWLAFLAPPPIFAGWLLFGLAALRQRPLPRWNVLPAFLGTVPLLMSLWNDLLEAPPWGVRIGAVAIGFGWLLLSYALWPLAAGRQPLPHGG